MERQIDMGEFRDGSLVSSATLTGLVRVWCAVDQTSGAGETRSLPYVGSPLSFADTAVPGKLHAKIHVTVMRFMVGLLSNCELKASHSSTNQMHDPHRSFFLRFGGASFSTIRGVVIFSSLCSRCTL